jgi:hypothetical protein
MNKRSPNNVVSIVSELAIRQKLRCPDCLLHVPSLEDWNVALDAPVSKHDPKGSYDSGMHTCPKCKELLSTAIFDGMVRYTTSSDQPGIHTYIPRSTLIKLLDDFEIPKRGKAHVNIGTAIMNAIKKELILDLGKATRAFFPSQKAEIEAILKNKSQRLGK